MASCMFNVYCSYSPINICGWFSKDEIRFPADMHHLVVEVVQFILIAVIGYKALVEHKL